MPDATECWLVEYVDLDKRTLFPLRCEWCDFTSRTPQGLGKHRKRCELRRTVAT